MRWLWNSSLLFWTGLYFSVATVSVQAETVAQLSLFWVGIMNGLFGASLLLVRIPIGIAAGKIPQKKLLFLGLLLVAAGNLVVPLVPHAGALLVSRFLLGAGAGFWVVFSIFYVNHHPRSEIPKAMARITLTYGLGITIGGLGGGMAAEQWGWHAPFWLGLGAAVLSMLLLLPVKEETRIAYSFQKRRLFSQFKNARLMVVSLLAALLFYLGTSTVWGFTPNFAFQEFGASRFELGVIAFAMLGPYAASIRFAYLPRGLLGAKGAVLSGLALAGLATFLIPFTGNITQVLFLHAFVGAGLGVVFSTTMSLSIEDLPLEQRGEAMGIFQSVYATGFLLGPFLGGIISDAFSLQFIFFINGAVTLLAVLLLLYSSVLTVSRTADPGEMAAYQKEP
ncbi:MAG: hypothetical protein A3D64_01165 [Candidatus Wildermuthbacteria bacterium RIFCSPHIGHO2_02_FULL_49_9]|uniref:Major facilitator superfamily (MFS) profile domain-containing protein n=2 Tax=Candidatus Wildermuthiibacteriota TaxID=1817923 RepID=A0A1G2QZ63_9BACT|nr:MAG: hypothetical protein A2672_02495 [Candidatus Wildermuthbacteria bacterium RIFCSPHIGHO2_01_FULL_49_22b]OHA70471.1 MAG: hypothetical protein A3D64_01165 [Candidatus Wildermuthbacteria bacterium RIFCSPHIGHO2_02_FULL_49_9]